MRLSLNIHWFTTESSTNYWCIMCDCCKLLIMELISIDEKNFILEYHFVRIFILLHDFNFWNEGNTNWFLKLIYYLKGNLFYMFSLNNLNIRKCSFFFFWQMGNAVFFLLLWKLKYYFEKEITLKWFYI